jgi:hypothetical protein
LDEEMNGPDPSADDAPRIGPGGRAAQAEIPAQAQVAAWARGVAACWTESCWAERAGPRESLGCPLLGRALCRPGRSRGPHAGMSGPRGKERLAGQIQEEEKFQFFFQKQYLYEFDEYLNEFE